MNTKSKRPEPEPSNLRLAVWIAIISITGAVIEHWILTRPGTPPLPLRHVVFISSPDTVEGCFENACSTARSGLLPQSRKWLRSAVALAGSANEAANVLKTALADRDLRTLWPEISHGDFNVGTLSNAPPSFQISGESIAPNRLNHCVLFGFIHFPRHSRYSKELTDVMAPIGSRSAISARSSQASVCRVDHPGQTTWWR